MRLKVGLNLPVYIFTLISRQSIGNSKFSDVGIIPTAVVIGLIVREGIFNRSFRASLHIARTVRLTLMGVLAVTFPVHLLGNIAIGILPGTQTDRMLRLRSSDNQLILDNIRLTGQIEHKIVRRPRLKLQVKRHINGC